MTVETFTPGSVVIPAGTPKDHCLWIVVKGSLMANSTILASTFDVLGGTKVADSSKQKGWGRFVSNNYNDVYESDVVAEVETDVASITLAMYSSCLGGQISPIQDKTEVIEALK